MSPLVPLTPNSTASIPLTINNKGKQHILTNPFNLYALQLPPLANQYYSCIFPIKWDNLYISRQYLTGDFRYQVLNKHIISRNQNPSEI